MSSEDGTTCGGTNPYVNEAPVASPSVDLLLKLEQTEHRFHQMVVAEVQVVLDELLEKVIDGQTLEGVHR